LQLVGQPPFKQPPLAQELQPTFTTLLPASQAHGWNVSCALQPHEPHEPVAAGAAAAAQDEQPPVCTMSTEPAGLGAPAGVPRRTTLS
jgi:hypothetical protein